MVRKLIILSINHYKIGIANYFFLIDTKILLKITVESVDVGVRWMYYSYPYPTPTLE